jgi:hypothetical protein
MLPQEITELLKNAQDLGNHFQKNIQNINNFYPAFQKTLSKYNLSRKLNLVHPGHHYSRDLNTIRQLPENSRTILDYLGCYCSLQLLRFNLHFLDWLDYQLTVTRNRESTYRKFMLDSGWEFRRITAAYMHNLLIFLSNGKAVPNFVITGVGTRSDQDDIDVGIIDDGGEDRIWLNKVIDRMGVEMMRFATNFHFHLSEHVGSQIYSASIPEYLELLTPKIGNFVILTEMLGAAFIIGDRDLFNRFRSEVTDRYYYRGSPNKYHEGYLRGILGEIVDLHARAVDKNHLHPKFDGLRIIKNAVYAYKTRFGIEEVNPWRILKILKKVYPRFRTEFLNLEKSLSFLEVFRYLYQQLVVQEEYIPISETAIMSNLQRVVSRLGYQDFGPYLGVNHLLHDYRDAVKGVHDTIPAIIEDLSHHLRHISVLKRYSRRLEDHPIVEDFSEQLLFFESAYYWNDIFSMLAKRPAKLNEALLAELDRMQKAQREEALNRLIEWTGYNPEFMFTFCSTFNSDLNEKQLCMLNEIISLYLRHYENDFDFVPKIVSFYRKHSTLMCKILHFFNATNLKELNKIVHRNSYRGEIALHQKNLAELVELVSRSSHYFKRVIRNIYFEFSNYTCFIREPDSIGIECDRILRRLPHICHVDLKKQAINNYYDLKFFQVGLETFKGKSVLELNCNFTSFVSIYFRELYKICLKEVVRNHQKATRLARFFTIYACGGNGRGQAFDDDFDMIIIVDCEHPAEKSLFREIISLMNTEMIKRGTLPHFRFSQHFGEYMCPYSELKQLMEKDYDGSYIDKSQLLEARLLYGAHFFHERFLTEIINGIIFARGEDYIRQMLWEIDQRHNKNMEFQDNCANIKECPGGLRDIEMVVLIYKVLYQLMETDTYQLINSFYHLDRGLQQPWKTIRNSLIFLQKFRYMYRLIMATDDNISNQGLEQLALKFHPELPAEVDPNQWMWEQFCIHRQRAWNAVGELISRIR